MPSEMNRSDLVRQGAVPVLAAAVLAVMGTGVGVVTTRAGSSSDAATDRSMHAAATAAARPSPAPAPTPAPGTSERSAGPPPAAGRIPSGGAAPPTRGSGSAGSEGSAGADPSAVPSSQPAGVRPIALADSFLRPPASYTRQPDSPGLRGRLDVVAFAALGGTGRTAEDTASADRLRSIGFAAGYARGWVSTRPERTLVVLVAEFTDAGVAADFSAGTASELAALPGAAPISLPGLPAVPAWATRVADDTGRYLLVAVVPRATRSYVVLLTGPAPWRDGTELTGLVRDQLVRG